VPGVLNVLRPDALLYWDCLREDRATFTAYACHPSFGDQVAQGNIVLEGWHLRFESESGKLEIPLVQLQIELGEPRDGRICFSSPNLADWTIYTFDQGILQQRSLLQQSHTRNQIKGIQSLGELKRRLKLTGLFLGSCVLVTLAGSLLTGLMVRALVARIPAQWEQELGDSVLEEVKLHANLVEDAKLQGRLERAVAPLAVAIPNAGLKFKYYIVEDPQANAFAVPGGYVFVTTALLQLAERPEEIAGVVAHELAHVTEKHGFRKIISSAGPYLILRIFISDRGGLLGLLGNSSQLLVSQGFSQEYELEADSVGWESLVAAHIDPRGLTEMLKKLKQEQEKLAGSTREIKAFSSHPPTEKRIRRLEAKWNKLKDKSQFVALPEESSGSH
jgi:Zn-dependent protease with chaperone function